MSKKINKTSTTKDPIKKKKKSKGIAKAKVATSKVEEPVKVSETIETSQAPQDSLSNTLSKRSDIEAKDFVPRIAVIGIGGGGGNAINNLAKNGLSFTTSSGICPYRY